MKETTYKKMDSNITNKALADALLLYGGLTGEMELVIRNTGRVPTRENTPGWYFEPGGPYYVPKSKFKSDLLDVLNVVNLAKSLAPPPPPIVNVRLIKFNMSLVPDDCLVFLIGHRYTGKTTIIKDLLWHKQRFPIGTVIGRMSDYKSILPSLFIHEDFDPAIIEYVLIRQEEIAKRITIETESGSGRALDRRAFVCLDDCFYDNTWISNMSMRSLLMNGRHYGLLTILSMQYPMGIPPVLREQADYVFILHENHVSARRRIYEMYADIFITFELFCQLMDQCTEGNDCLVIHNNGETKKLEDCVFWYQAELHPDFKIGSREHWLRSAELERLANDTGS